MKQQLSVINVQTKEVENSDLPFRVTLNLDDNSTIEAAAITFEKALCAAFNTLAHSRFKLIVNR